MLRFGRVWNHLNFQILPNSSGSRRASKLLIKVGWFGEGQIDLFINRSVITDDCRVPLRAV